ncbi:MAG: right-handed parallel beta-helix repeat-containing protein [Methanothrix sp.]|jgi:parallel beta-helix repeat protein|nr:right-handed parallel beta-helix repeat-containing protein [Methanothrix sp.]
MKNGLSPMMSKSILAILVVTVVLLSGSANATLSVKPGNSIQSAIDAVSPGQTIEVQNGTFRENINVTKPLILKGVGRPVIDAGGKGSAITISANGSTLLGFTAMGAGEDANDAGIRIISCGNIIKDNAVIKNNNYGIILYHADKNTVFLNTVTENKNGGILLIHSNNNQVWGNYAGFNWNGITMESSRSNIINANNLTGNKLGINILNVNLSDSITTNGKAVSIKYVSSSQSTTYNIDKNSTSSSLGANLLYQNYLQDNDQNAFDDGYNQWNNDKAGNHYSNYDSHEQGCKDRNRDGICDAGYSIAGGHNVDKLPKASPDAILSYKSQGLGGFELKIEHRTYLPGSDINVLYVAPRYFSGWVGVMGTDQPRGKASQKKALSYQNLADSSGILKLKAPDGKGTYILRMYNITGSEEMASLNFNVGIPTITAAPVSVNTCEQITINYTGAPGYENDWIAMYESGSSDTTYITRQYLDGKENGTVILDAPDTGSYNFRIFENDSYNRLAISNNVEAKTRNGTKVLVSSYHVASGDTVTVTYWGAPAEGTGIIGMYGMNRPDKFPIGKRSIGSKNCGRMTWQLPSSPGQYDFRMFRSDITDYNQGAYQLLGQSDVVTVS